MPISFGLTPRSMATFMRIIAKYVSAFPGIEFFVFGSRARGDHKDNSDLDLLIKNDHLLPQSARSQIAEDFEESDLPIKIDIVLNSELYEPYRSQIEIELRACPKIT